MTAGNQIRTKSDHFDNEGTVFFTNGKQEGQVRVVATEEGVTVQFCNYGKFNGKTFDSEEYHKTLTFTWDEFPEVDLNLWR